MDKRTKKEQAVINAARNMSKVLDKMHDGELEDDNDYTYAHAHLRNMICTLDEQERPCRRDLYGVFHSSSEMIPRDLALCDVAMYVLKKVQEEYESIRGCGSAIVRSHIDHYRKLRSEE
jgi:hypothetical protein